MKTIFLLMDSLNRDYLKLYGSEKIKTPNLDRLLKRSIVFDNHYAGSLPCMPARRELLTGRLNFMEAPWGPIEPWDKCLPDELRTQKQTYSHMITDHYHYFHSGGEGYHTLFDTWEFERGQEGDVWHPLVTEPKRPKFTGKNRRAYWVNREFYDKENENEYPTPRCFQRAIEFLDNNGHEDNWHLHLEVFDPHEPFVCPQKYSDIYKDDWDDGYHFDWPSYEKVAQEEAAVTHIKKSYAGVLTMADVWLGKFLDKMDEMNLWDDTVLILTTDHGYLLGEHGYWAKNYMRDYQELVKIPLVICTPQTENAPGRVSALTAAMDVMPTIMQFHGASVPTGVHGKSLVHLLEKDEKHHDAVLYGYFGKDINLCDGKYTYCRQPEKDSKLWINTAVPRAFHGFYKTEKLAASQIGAFLPNCDGIPHYRIPAVSHRHADAAEEHLIFDIESDPHQETPVKDDNLEKKLMQKMVELMKRYDAPKCQYERTGLVYE